MTIPTKAPEPGERVSVPLALQRLFYTLLPTAPEPVAAASTVELTDAFGWSKAQARQQQDIQELMRVLFDHLDEKLKGGPRAGELDQLQRLTIKSYVRCKHVDYESSRKETHLDLGVEVKGQKDLHGALKEYCKPESLDGENKYDAGPMHGLQEATKGVSILSTPPVLHIHLKRFDYDMMRDVTVKVNDRFEFPFEIDFSQYIEPEEPAPGQKVAKSPKEAKMAKREIIDEGESGPSSGNPEGCEAGWARASENVYLLQAVVVHSGGSNAGHYYAFVRPDVTTDRWVVCNDSTVAEATEAEVKATYGLASTGTTSTNAYMLTYVRKSDAVAAKAALVDHPLGSVVPSHVTEHFESRQTMEKEKQEEAKEQARWLQCKVAKLPGTLPSGQALDAAFQSDACHFDALKSFQPQKLAEWLTWPKEGPEGELSPLAGSEEIKVTQGDIATVRGGDSAIQVWRWHNNELSPFPNPMAVEDNLGTYAPMLGSSNKHLCLVMSETELIPAKEGEVYPTLVSLRCVRAGPGAQQDGAPHGLTEALLGTYSLPAWATVAEIKTAVAALVDGQDMSAEVPSVQLFVAKEQKTALDPNSIDWAKGAKLLEDAATVQSLVDAGLLRGGRIVFVDTSGRLPVPKVLAAPPTLAIVDDDDLYDDLRAKKEEKPDQSPADAKEQEPGQVLVPTDIPASSDGPSAMKTSPPDVMIFFQWRGDHLQVILRAKPKQGSTAPPDHQEWLPKSSDYQALAAHAGAALGAKDGHLQLYKQASFSSTPWQPITPAQWYQGQTLGTILNFVPKPIVLQYEELELSLEEVAKTQEIKVKCWLPLEPKQGEQAEGKEKREQSERLPSYEQIRVPKGGKIADLRAAAASKLGCEASSVRLYHVYQQVSNEEVGRLLEDETSLQQADNMGLGKNKIYAQRCEGEGEEVKVCHYELRGQLVKRFGEPFVFRVGAGETAQALLRRVGHWLGMGEEACGDWAVALIQGGPAAKVAKELQGEDDVMAALAAARETLNPPNTNPVDKPDEEKKNKPRPDKILHLGLRHRASASANPPRSVGITIARSPRGSSVAAKAD